jgi:hypothetical protein
MKKRLIGIVLIAVATSVYAEYFQFFNNTKNATFNITIHHANSACDVDPQLFTLQPQTNQTVWIGHDSNYEDDQDCNMVINTWSPTLSEGDNIYLQMTMYPERYADKAVCSQMLNNKFYLCRDNWAQQEHPKYLNIYNISSIQYFDPLKN